MVLQTKYVQTFPHLGSDYKITYSK